MPYIVIFILSVVILMTGILASIASGAVDITLGEIIRAVFNYDASDNTHVIIHDIRLPRVLAAAFAGAAFSVSGAIMQAMTRNPLAEPGILGVNAGALFFLTIALTFFPFLPFPYLMAASVAGAFFSILIVGSIAIFSRSGLTPLKLILAGLAVTLFFSALSAAIQLYFNTGQDVAFWSAGAVQNIGWNHLVVIIPFIIIGLIIALFLSQSLTAISFDEKTAVSLGVRMTRSRILALASVTVLAGLAVSAAGAVAFVGLIVPHITRKIAGADYNKILPLSGVLGAALVVFADFAARVLFMPVELPVAALIALIGVPFFLYLAGRVRHDI